MLKLRRKPESSSSTEVDFLNLCKSNVHSVKVLVHSGSLLNKRQCQDLSSKLSETAQNIEALVLYCGATAADFRPVLESLNRYVEKAKVLVRKCREKDWCAAAVFQIQNENAFRDILLDLGLCYNAIYEQAKSTRGDWRAPPEDLRLSSMFAPASNIDVSADNEDFKKRLDDLANGYINLSWMDYFRAGKVTRKQSLARYLLVKMYCTSLEPQANTLDSYSAILWRKNSEPSGTWGNSHFLGAGSGASGVCSTEWLGIPCAKKEFHGQESEHFFMKEAGILAHLKHPCIVNFICCGNGLERGDRFIAMELMEKSLYNLIEDQKSVPFSHHVVVDMMVQIARGVCYLHGQGVAHRDLKPQNVVVSRLASPHDLDYYCVKLVDFGISKTKVEVSKSNTMTQKGIGTTRYRAPEVFPQAHPNGIGKATWFQADVYSFAMTCVHLLSLKTPLGEMQNLSELYEKLMNGTRPELHVDCPEELKALLKDCWNTQPRSRPSFTEVCTRLERLKHASLRGFISRNDGFQESNEGNEGIDFIKMKVEKELSIQKLILDGIGDEEEKRFDSKQLPILSCSNGHALEFLPLLSSNYNGCYCDICGKDIDKELYHCEACAFDAHLHCATIKVEVKTFFHNHPLHLLIENYYKDDLKATCRYCEELLKHSEWVYRCEQCDFDVHAHCTKYLEEMTLRKYWHPHCIILVQCPPHKILACAYCNGEVRGNTWRYTCIERWCSFDVHPCCITIPKQPICVFENSHRLSLKGNKRSFYCGICGALGFSCYYHCNQCNVDMHLDCTNDMEEDYWYNACEDFIAQHMTKDDLTKVDIIAQLLDKLFVHDILERQTSSTSRSLPASEGLTIRVQPTIQRFISSEEPDLDAIANDVDLRKKIEVDTAERKAKRMTAKGGRLEVKAKSLEMLGHLERVLADMQLSSESKLQGDAGVLASTLEKLRNRKYLAEEELATQEQSTMRHGPRTCLFYLENENDERELLTSLRADLMDVKVMFLCEEPGHQHFVAGSSFVRFFLGELGEDRVQKLQPLLARGLQVVAMAMSASTGQLTRAESDSVMLPNLGVDPWDLQAFDLEKHGKSPIKDKEIADVAENSAAEWILRDHESFGGLIYKSYGLLRIRYKATEEGNCPRFTRGSMAWLCTEHLNRGIEAGILESYPIKYYDRELN